MANIHVFLSVMLISRHPFVFVCRNSTKHILPQSTLSDQWNTTQWKVQESTVLFCNPFGKSLGTYLQQLSRDFQHTRTRTNDKKVQIKYVSSALGIWICYKILQISLYVLIREKDWMIPEDTVSSNWEEHHFRIKKPTATDFQSTTKFK